MRHISKNIKHFFFLIVGLLALHSLFAQSEPIYSDKLPKSGDSIAIGKFLIVEDSVFVDSALRPSILRTNAVNNIISLRLNEFGDRMMPDSFLLDVKVRVYYYSKENVEDSITEKTLSINYYKNKKYDSKAILTFQDAYYVKVKVLDITVAYSTEAIVLPLVELENVLSLDRDYTIACSHDAITEIDKDESTVTDYGELTVSWAHERVAERYDVEWTFIDKSALDAGRYNTGADLDPNLIFKNNATRITVKTNSTMIPLLYDGDGTLFYRVRPVSVDQYGEVWTANWSSDYVSDGGLGSYEFTGHERKLNWQATTSFAEDGKRKSVVQYFDGSLRGRQTVTRDNTTMTTVVAETLYDKQGRAVIQVMPAPTLSTLIAYTPGFNVLNMSGDEYGKNIYDTLLTEADYCAATVDSMSALSGANNYYSKSNPLRDEGFHKYIPNAYGYAFTETQYVQDNSGRVYRQSGVGRDFVIGSGKETKYYYGNAEQTDLDALFGTEVGDASHYQKNMVRDANGQYSVSYVDMHGRTIATALAGLAPGSLQQLDSYRDSIQTEELLNSTNNIINGTSIESSKSLLVSRADTNTFHYTFGPQVLKLADCKADSICYDCLYDLTITISDDCNNQLLGGSPIVIKKSNFTLFHVDTACGTVTPLDTTFKFYLYEGSYTISKKLSISKYGMDYYRDSLYIPHNTCKTYEDFLAEEFSYLSTHFTCTSDTLASIPDYASHEEMMLHDLYPLSGQYGDSAKARECYSIFDKIDGRYRYQSVADTGFYRNENGDADVVTNSNGDLVPPQFLTPDEFISNFKESWAFNLLSLHPEYDLLVQYKKFASSLDWDIDFDSTNTYSDALSKGYLNPTYSSSSPASNFTVNHTDPLYGYSFATGAKATIEDSMLHYRSGTGDMANPYLTFWGVATIASKCSSPTTSACMIHWNKSGNVFNDDSLCTGELDHAWQMFRELYKQQKHFWIDRYIREHSSSSYPVQPCIPAFPRYDSLMKIGGYTGDPSSYVTDSITVVAQLSQFYSNNCHAYANEWLQELGTCNYLPAQRDTIIAHLEIVCREGSDINHPYGASSVKPGSTSVYKSFDEVVRAYNTMFGITTNINCNAYLIKHPLPYDQPGVITNIPVNTKPDSCVCANITRFYNDFMLHESQYATFSNYMFQLYHTTITNGALDTLRNLCGGTTCTFLTDPIYLPPAFQCNVGSICVGCDSIHNLYDSFLVRFPSQIPTLAEDDSTQFTINTVFANYMNQHFGFSNSAQEYLRFKDQCDSFHTPADTSRNCANYKRLLNNYPAYYDSLISYNRPVALDSGGCNVRNWGINYQNVGLYHQFRYKWSDYLQSGAIRRPVNDTLHADTVRAYNFYDNGMGMGLCIDTAFTIEYRLKNPVDSARMRTYNRNGGDTSDYGKIRYEIFFGDEKLYSLLSNRVIGISPSFQLIRLATNNIEYGSISDASLTMNFNDWQTVKLKFSNTHLQVYDNGMLLKTYSNIPLGGYFHGFDMTGYGYDFQMDYVKFYDHKDSLIYFEDFNSCDWAKPKLDRRCTYDCDTTFKNYFNSKLGTSYTYTQIKNLYETTCGSDFYPCSYTGPLFCGKQAVDSSINPYINPCADSTNIAIVTATQLYQIYNDSLLGHFNEAYTAKCLNAVNLESFTVTHPVSEYHYTLYYYDQAGNLVKTIPPEGVKPDRDPTWLGQIKTKRASGDTQVPLHELPTVYRYNSLNQVVTQESPDGGLSKFWYDRLGRLVISQNEQQALTDKYSYTLYDFMGRITEVGEKKQLVAMNNTIARDPKALRSWTQYHYTDETYWPRQVTSTVYDDVSNFAPVYEGFTPFKQKAYTMRNRVSYSRFYDELNQYGPYEDEDSIYTPYYENFNTAIEYSYDIHGNVDSILNIGNVNTMIVHYAENAFKMIAYKYDLISGKVNEVHYNPGYKDEFFHRYEYDAENRLTDVYTTDNKALLSIPALEEHDAHYEYYKHGPLAREVIGQQQVQGVDYAYTLQGWLKGVNSLTLDAAHDMGADGESGGTNKNVARDAYGFNLSYFVLDYNSINDDVTNFPESGGYLSTAYKPLYNGNIASMAVNIGSLRNTRLYNYKYDQLNRIVAMDAYKGFASNSWMSYVLSNDFKERIAYDANGNIKSYLRNGYGDLPDMDDLHYSYNAGKNQLNQVTDEVNAGNYSADIDNQSVDNYKYDSIGNLISDDAAKIASVNWTVYGKIAQIVKTTSFIKGESTQLDYMYNPNGQRVQKTNSRYDDNTKYEWYVRDAQGNTMAVYRATETEPFTPGPLILKEHDIYGSSRLGVVNREIDMTDLRPMERLTLLGPSYLSSFERGDKQYELTNHLGNVLVTIADTKTAVADISNSSLIDHYVPDVITAHDYYPFGMLMPGRTSDELQQADADDAPTPIRVEAEHYIYNSGGMTVVTTTDTGGGDDLSSINAGEYSVYWLDAPVAGQYLVKFRVAGDASSFQFKDSSLNVLSVLNMPNTGGDQNWITITAVVTLPAGMHQYHFYGVSASYWNLNWIEFSLRSVVADGGNDDLVTLGKYRYGFNGKENDDEVKGEANQQDYGERFYDPRLGKFLSVDPISSKYPMLTPYQFAANSTISGIDLDGLEYYYTASGKLLGHRTTDARGEKLDEKTSNNVKIASDMRTITDPTTKKQYVVFDVVKDLNISNKDFINRQNWAYGEGGGDAAQYYAHTINNLSKQEGENKMYIHMNQGSSTTPEAQIKKYFQDFSEGNKNYKRFRQYINGTDYLSKTESFLKSYYENKFVEVFKATVGVLDGTLKDPTNGSTNWAGDQSSIAYALKYNKGSQITVVKQSSIYGYTSYNIFYQLGPKKLKPETTYTLITISPSNEMKTETISVLPKEK